jgi:hypothetical protein
MRHLLIVAGAAALALGACATADRVDAAADIHAFLVAVRDNDKVGFEQHVDRGALTRSFEYRIQAEAARADTPKEIKIAAAALSGPAAKVAEATLVRPSVFRFVAYNLGYKPGEPLPKTIHIAAALRPVDSGRVCAAESKKSPCLLTFAREGDAWRLVSIDAPLRDLRL